MQPPVLEKAGSIVSAASLSAAFASADEHASATPKPKRKVVSASEPLSLESRALEEEEDSMSVGETAYSLSTPIADDSLASLSDQSPLARTASSTATVIASPASLPAVRSVVAALHLSPSSLASDRLFASATAAKRTPVRDITVRNMPIHADDVGQQLIRSPDIQRISIPSYTVQTVTQFFVELVLFNGTLLVSLFMTMFVVFLV